MTSTEVIFSSKLHKDLITCFINDVYEMAEMVKCSDMQISYFSYIVTDIIDASNNLYREIDESLPHGNERDMFMNEWVYKIPTNLLYATLGMFSGIRTEHNKDLLDEIIRNILDRFNEIYEKLEEVTDINYLLDNIHLN